MLVLVLVLLVLLVLVVVVVFVGVARRRVRALGGRRAWDGGRGQVTDTDRVRTEVSVAEATGDEQVQDERAQTAHLNVHDGASDCQHRLLGLCLLLLVLGGGYYN